jgi:hypothetical protein
MRAAVPRSAPTARSRSSNSADARARWAVVAALLAALRNAGILSVHLGRRTAGDVIPSAGPVQPGRREESLFSFARLRQPHRGIPHPARPGFGMTTPPRRIGADLRGMAALAVQRRSGEKKKGRPFLAALKSFVCTGHACEAIQIYQSHLGTSTPIRVEGGNERRVGDSNSWGCFQPSTLRKRA